MNGSHRDRDMTDLMRSALSLQDVKDMWKDIKSGIGVRLRGITLVIDLMNGCPLRCPSCSVGNLGTRDKGVMPIKLFGDIMKKCVDEIKVRRVSLASWSDSLVYPDIDKAIKICRNYGIETIVSTTLNKKRPDLRKILGADKILVSISGFSNYEYHHSGGTLKTVIENLVDLSLLTKKVAIVYHRYKNDERDYVDIKNLAEGLGFEFRPIEALFMGIEKILNKSYSADDLMLIGDLNMTPEEKIATYEPSDYCFLQSKEITMDALGRVYLCDAVYEDEFILGYFMDMSVNQIREKMFNHSFCRHCKMAKVNRYITPN